MFFFSLKIAYSLPCEATISIAVILSAHILSKVNRCRLSLHLLIRSELEVFFFPILHCPLEQTIQSQRLQGKDYLPNQLNLILRWVI